MTKRIEPPEDWRELDVKSDDGLTTMEKELSLNCPNDLDSCLFFSSSATFVKWFQSVEEAEPDWVRIDDNGNILAVAGKIPKGIVKLKGDSRKSNYNSQMVAYGPHK